MTEASSVSYKSTHQDVNFVFNSDAGG